MQEIFQKDYLSIIISIGMKQVSTRHKKQYDWLNGFASLWMKGWNRFYMVYVIQAAGSPLSSANLQSEIILANAPNPYRDGSVGL